MPPHVRPVAVALERRHGKGGTHGLCIMVSDAPMPGHPCKVPDGLRPQREGRPREDPRRPGGMDSRGWRQGGPCVSRRMRGSSRWTQQCPEDVPRPRHWHLWRPVPEERLHLGTVATPQSRGRKAGHRGPVPSLVPRHAHRSLRDILLHMHAEAPRTPKTA